MERIAPLAKILAEANGIEWQQLAGTGAGGQVVEQDILDYLTRVMSGEAEPPSTPVDAPPPDWDGQDLPGGGIFDASALSKAGVESDIAEFVSQGRPAGPQQTPLQVPGTGTPTLSTDDFELDDAPAVSSPAAASPISSPTVSSTPATTLPSEPVTAAPEVQVASSFASSAAPVAAAGAVAGGLGNLLSRLYQKEETAASVEAPVPVLIPATSAAPTPSGSETQTMHAPTLQTPAEPARYAAEVPVPAAATSSAVMPEVTPRAAQLNSPAFAPPAFEVPRDDRIAVPAAPLAHVGAPPASTPIVSAPVTETPAAPVQEQAKPAAQLPRDSVWFGTYLRRNADVAALSELRTQLGEALERDVPVALLVARAAQRHADQLGLGSVATQDLQANEARGVGQGSLRDALEANSRFEGTPDLLVVDAGALDLDDLHYPHTLTLSVGRIEGGKASLSLQGDVERAKAAQFLASVAQTLAKPVILLV